SYCGSPVDHHVPVVQNFLCFWAIGATHAPEVNPGQLTSLAKGLNGPTGQNSADFTRIGRVKSRQEIRPSHRVRLAELGRLRVLTYEPLKQPSLERCVDGRIG